ncbi:MAG TPA: efflux RND transporter periplasmic adaptor subunit [Pirellulaceae bacterium]|jgi:multidrug efflux pump subunit AcrA (membrane-fusion protein)|nr:efflux RND transporter periplasmic adaptor subunit [Pirellulaceae bacterium]
MNMRLPRLRSILLIATVVVVLVAAGAAAATYRLWSPWAIAKLEELRDRTSVAADAGRAGHDGEGDDHAGHDHGAEGESIHLSDAALKNVGFEPFALELRPYEKSTAIPALVVERPGRSQLLVTAPLTGVVTQIHVIQGVAISEGDPLFELRLTHEDLVQSQSDLLKTAEALSVVERELARLKTLDPGVVAGKRLLELEYELQKLRATLESDRQTLLLHGLTEEDVAGILQSRKLVQFITVKAPAHDHAGENCKEDHRFTVAQVPVKKGQLVELGAPLATLADHCELYVEGMAFEDDADELRQAMVEGRKLSATFSSAGRSQSAEGGSVITGLSILYLADTVDPDSRAFRFYVSLPNEIAADRRDASGLRFLDWRFKPGQRMTLRAPLETFEKRFVLPANAVVDDGAETFVYRQNGDAFERVPVHVAMRDDRFAVLGPGGDLFPGDVVAGAGAYQIHLALKNQAGGGADPHAGHSH